MSKAGRVLKSGSSATETVSSNFPPITPDAIKVGCPRPRGASASSPYSATVFAQNSLHCPPVGLAREHRPIIHVENDAVLVAAVGLEPGEVGASAILDGEGA